MSETPLKQRIIAVVGTGYDFLFALRMLIGYILISFRRKPIAVGAVVVLSVLVWYGHLEYRFFDATASYQQDSSLFTEEPWRKHFDTSSDLHQTINTHYSIKYRWKIQRSFQRVYNRFLQHEELFEKVSRDTGLPVSLLFAIAVRESNITPGAVSIEDARGVMQVMPSHWQTWKKAARRCGDAYYDYNNMCHGLYAGALVFSNKLTGTKGDVMIALLHYHLGPNHREWVNARALEAERFLSMYYGINSKEKYYALEVMSWALAFESYQTFGKIKHTYQRESMVHFFEHINLNKLLTVHTKTAL